MSPIQKLDPKMTTFVSTDCVLFKDNGQIKEEKEERVKGTRKKRNISII